MAEPIVPKDSRPRFGFEIPEQYRLYEKDPKKVVFVPLSMGMEQDAFRVAEATKVGAVTELVRRSVESIDGKQVEAGSMWLEEMSPPCRAVLGRIYKQQFDVDEDEFKEIFRKRTVEVR